MRVIAGARHWTICGEAENGLGGVQQFADLKPDLVIIDLALPDMNGLEAAKRMSSLDRTAPLFLFTITDVEGLRPAARKAGISQVVSKFHVWDLIRRVENTTTPHQELALEPIEVSA
jgi:DNA-binding NarL/FixJ family response regulator